MICTRAVVIQRNYNIFEYQVLHAKLHGILGDTAISLHTLRDSQEWSKNSGSLAFFLDYR